MASYVLVVPSDPKPGQDDEYNHWYDEQHLGDLLAIPGFTSARRFTADPASPNPTDAGYLTLYEIETDDPAEMLAELVRRAQSGQMPISPALDTGSAKMMLFKAR